MKHLKTVYEKLKKTREELLALGIVDWLGGRLIFDSIEQREQFIDLCEKDDWLIYGTDYDDDDTWWEFNFKIVDEQRPQRVKQ